MKIHQKISLYLLLGLGTFTACQASTPSFWAIDPQRNQTEYINPELKTSSILKFNSQPLKIRSLTTPSGGYLLLCQGSAKLLGDVATPGSLVYLDRAMQPTGSQIKLPGIVKQELYLETNALWLIITTNKQTITLNLIQPGNTEVHQFKLSAFPNFYQLNAEKTQLALALNPQNQSSTVMLIDLKEFKTRSLPVGINTGAIYFTQPERLVVASGGFRETQKYPSSSKVQTTPQSQPAHLEWLDLITGRTETLTLGYSPAAVIQDQSNSDIFYSTTLNQAIAPEPRSTFRTIKNGKVIGELAIPDEITRIVQTASGNLCLLGQVRFYLVNPKETKILTEITTDLRIDSIKFSQDGAYGYLFIVNSSKIPVINLQTGQQPTPIKTGGSSFFDTFKGLSLGVSLFATPLSPVTGNNPLWSNKNENSLVNQRILFNQNHNRLFVLTSSNQLSVIDLKTNQIERTIKLNGVCSGFHLVPGSSRLMAITDRSWDLIDPEQKNLVLSVSISRGEESAQKGYYNADGTRLAVPFYYQVNLIDTQNGKYLGKIPCKTQNPSILWP